jgi:hypothetical protein
LGVLGGGEKFADGVEGTDVNGGGRARGAGERGLIDHHHLADFFVASDGADNAGLVLGDLAFEALQVAVEDLVDEGAFAGAGDTGEAAEDAEGQLDIDFFEVVLAGAGDFQVVLCLASRRGDRDGFAAGEIVGGEGAFLFFQALEGAGIDELTAVAAATGADLDEVVGGAHDGFLVLDDEQGVAFVAQAFHDADQAADVARVQADAGLVEDEEGVHQRGPEAGGEVDALEFAAGEAAGEAVEVEVAEPCAVEVAEAGGDFVTQHGGGVIGWGDGQGLDEGQQIGDRKLPEVGDGFVLETEVIGLFFQAAAVAIGTGGVGAEAAEEDADVHLVGAGFEPFEEAAHAVPLAVLPGFLGIVALAFDDPAALGVGEVLEGFVERDAVSAGGAFEVGLALGVGAALESANEAFLDGEGFVGDGFAEVEAEGAAEAAAGGAGAEGVVEGEEAGGGSGQGEVAVGAAPVGGEGSGDWGGRSV